MASNPQAFDVAIGLDANALNSAIAEFYAAFPSLFTQTFNIPADVGGGTAAVAIQAAPTISKLVSAGIYQGVCMQVTCSQVEATVQAEDFSASLTASVSGLAQAECWTTPQGRNEMWIGIAELGFHSGDQYQDAMINQFAMEPLATYLSNLLTPLAIPMIQAANVNLVTPIAVAETTPGGDQVLLAYSGMSPVGAPPPGTDWPSSAAFIALDAPLLEAIAANALKSYSGSVRSGDVSADYSLDFPNPGFRIAPGGGASVTIVLNMNGSAGLTLHTPSPFPDLDASADISGSASATGLLTMLPSGSSQQISFQLQNIGNINLSFDDVPSWLPTGDVLDAIADALQPVLEGLTFDICTLDPITFDFEGVAGSISLQNLNASQIAGPGGVPLLIATARPSIAAASSSAAFADAAPAAEAVATPVAAPAA